MLSGYDVAEVWEMFLRHLNYMELIVMGTGSDVVPEAYLMSESSGSNQNSGGYGGPKNQELRNNQKNLLYRNPGSLQSVGSF